MFYIELWGILSILELSSVAGVESNFLHVEKVSLSSVFHLSTVIEFCCPLFLGQFIVGHQMCFVICIKSNDFAVMKMHCMIYC